MISMLKAIEMLASVNYRELYWALWATTPPGQLVDNTNKESPPILPKWHIPDEPEKSTTTRMLYRLRGSTHEHKERVSIMDKLRQQIYQDAYCSRVRLGYINNPDIQLSTSATKDEGDKSSSGVGNNRQSLTSPYQEELDVDVTGEDEDVAHSASSQDANSIPFHEGKDDETVNDVLEIVQMINTQPFSENETLWMQALRDAEQKSTGEATNQLQTPPQGSSYVPSSSENGTHQESSGPVFLEGSLNIPSTTAEADGTSPTSHIDESYLGNAASVSALDDPSGSLSCEGKVATSQPQSEGGCSMHAQENVPQGRTFQGVMERIDAMMAQPLEIGGETGSMLPWLQAMGYKEDKSPRPSQPVPRQSQRMMQPNLLPTLPPNAAAELRFLSTFHHIPSAATPLITQPRAHRTPTPACVPPTPAANLSPRPPKVNNKRKLGNENQTPPEINTKAQRKGPSNPKAPPAQIDSFVFAAVPLPAESSFIPVLHESELEDVMRQGTPVCLGKGVFGEVLLKRRISDGTLVAVKKIQNVKDSMETYEEMVQEIRVMMAVQHLKEFPKVLGIIDQETFAIEFVGDPVAKKSKNLNSILANPPANLETLDWIQICLDMSRGLLALHNAGWSHNDLHNGNIMVWCDINQSNKWGAKVIDLGLATRTDLPYPEFMWTSSRKSWCHKNCPHLPPEVIEGVCKQGIKSDIYSLGHLFRIISDKNTEKLSFIRDLSERCRRRMPHDRPSMDLVVKDIEKFKNETMNTKTGPRGRVTGFR